MRVRPIRLEVEGDDASAAVALDGDGSHDLGALTVDVAGLGSDSITWHVANREDTPVRVRRVSIVFEVGHDGPLRMFRHGYQSWSRSSVAVLGVDVDPSCTPGSLEMVQGLHHADQRRAAEGELRSEWVTVLADASSHPAMLWGFDAGAEHDGTWRLRTSGTGDEGRAELRADAFLGDAQLAAGERRPLVGFGSMSAPDVSSALDDWASRVGQQGVARVAAPYQVGWCSWYHYFHGVTEQHLRDNLARAGDWPFDVFQLDDGFQAAIGDWLDTNDKFPSTIDQLAASIASAGRRPGLWIAPFIVAPDSQVATDHPEWLASFADGKPLWGMFNPEWGGGRDGVMYALDTTNPDVIAHLERLARSLVDAGFTYLKLDFTFAPSFDGTWADPSFTPSQRVRAGYDAIRRGAGDDAFILGCGVPLSHVVGVVDGNRIGPDVAPSWELPPDQVTFPGYEHVAPATLHSWVDTLTRSFMHRRLWLNDPDCLMLRTSETAMSHDAVRTWAHAVAVSGGMALVSDDLALLGDDAHELLDEVVAIGREVDAAAASGPAPRCEDLMAEPVPRSLRGGGYFLEGDPATATSTLQLPAD